MNQVGSGTDASADLSLGYDSVLILDFGSQYSQLIARRVREAQVYCEIVPWNITAEAVRTRGPKGLIFSGGPASVYAPGAPRPDPALYDLQLPILGICYGMQLLAVQLGGRVQAAAQREYGRAAVFVDDPGLLLGGLPAEMDVWMSHGDLIQEMPPGFSAIARSANSPVAAMAGPHRRYGIQFHPEVAHTYFGKEILTNFLTAVCGCRQDWQPDSFVKAAVARIQERAGSRRAICALSGGVDSTVAATLVHRAIGPQLTCIFVDNGLLRHNEAQRVIETLAGQQHIQLVALDESRRFLNALSGISDPEAKRITIGRTFIDVFQEQAKKQGATELLVQGTLYPDVIESTGPDTAAAQKIKTHHNVGGLPESMDLELIEPLRYLFKDEVRQVGISLGLPEELVWRHPFPGPGLAIRIIGEVTEPRLRTLRAADWIVIDEIKRSGLYRRLWQAFAILTPLSSVGVMGDGRTYENVVAVRLVESDDGMTADWARVPYDVLEMIGRRIVNEVPGVNRVVYDISSKPPATIEWE